MVLFSGVLDWVDGEIFRRSVLVDDARQKLARMFEVWETGNGRAVYISHK